MSNRRHKTVYLGVRITEEQFQKLVALSTLDTALPGNVSDAVRKLIDMAPINSVDSAQFCGYETRLAVIAFPHSARR